MLNYKWLCADNTVEVSYVTVNIEDIKVGDLVYSYDTATGEVSLKAVTDTFVRNSDHINHLTIIDEHGHEQTIETTDGHPFWVVTDNPDLSRAARSVVDGLYHEGIEPTEHGYWVEAKDLRVGDVFLGANGELSTLINAVRVEQSGGIAVFNFSVEGNHNYYVLAKEYEYGQTCILVHNAKYPNDFQTPRTQQARAAFGSEREARNYAYQKLGKNPVDIGDNKIRSIDGTLQYRAKPVDINATDPHVHLEKLDPKTGEVLKNTHLNYPAKVKSPVNPSN